MSKNKSWLSSGFVAHSKNLMESPSWQARTMPLRHILERLELEHVRHAGQNNGQLYVSNSQFVDAGVSRKSIRPALQLGGALGLLDVKPSPFGSRTAVRPPNMYTLNYVPTIIGGFPTDEWTKISKAQADKSLAIYKAAMAKRNKP